MRYLVALFCSLAMMTTSCKGDKTAAPEPAATQSPTSTAAKHSLPPMSKDVYENLRERCSAVDYIFHNLPFSINQTEKASVLSNLNFIGPEQADAIPSTCSPLGREFFQDEKADIFLEADIYYGEGCLAYVFFQDGKAVYANKMSQAGVEFYTKIIRNVTSQAKQAMQGK